MSGSKPYPQELRERAVRMVAEVRPNYESDWAAITAVAAKLGVGTDETLRKWMRQAQVDAGTRTGVSTEESAELRPGEAWGQPSAGNAGLGGKRPRHEQVVLVLPDGTGLCGEVRRCNESEPVADAS